MIDKKQRIELRSIASKLKPLVFVGKDGFSENVLKQISEELFNHELLRLVCRRMLLSLLNLS